MFAYEKVKEQIRYRIDSGYYIVRQMPSYRKLAKELGVSTFTVRRALDELHDKNEQHKNSDATSKPSLKQMNNGANRIKRIGYLCPEWSHYPHQGFFTSHMHEYNVQFKMLPYYDWQDPSIMDSLKALDGCFIAPCAQCLPKAVADQIRKSGTPTIILDRDTSAMGIHCLRMIRPIAMTRLLDHLADTGHTRIACLNAQPHDEIISERIELYRLWMMTHQQPAMGVDTDPQNYSPALKTAYQLVRQKIQSADWSPTAIAATTLWGAIGAIRALKEAGITPGRDIAVCAVADEFLAEYIEPAITTADAAMPDQAEAFLHACMQWIISGKAWEGPMLLQPADVQINVRASTANYKHTK